MYFSVLRKQFIVWILEPVYSMASYNACGTNFLNAISIEKLAFNQNRQPDAIVFYLKHYVTVVKLYVTRIFIADDSEFEGCIFRAQFDNHWPIKRVFQEPRPSFVSVDPNFDAVREERCGFEEILPPEEPLEMRQVFLNAILVMLQN